MYCTSCGNRIPESAAYCPGCGRPIFTAAQNPPPAAWPGATERLGIGARVWCALCIAANLAAFGVNLFVAVSARGGPHPALIVFMAAGVTAAIGLLILFCGRKEGFIILCAAGATSIITNLIVVNVPAALLGVANPLITWLIVRGSWHRMNIPGAKLKSRTAALVLASIPHTAFFGIDRFYLGYIWTGFLKFFTCGGCLVWYVMDIVRIANGKMTNKYGRPLRKSGE